MSLLSKITEFVTGGIGEKLIDTVKDYFPPSMTDAQKSEVERVIRQAAREHELQLINLAQQEQALFDERIRDMEGTAKDLNQFGWFGKIIVFLRGAQRPTWGFFVLYLDYQVFVCNKWPTVQIGESANAMGLDFQSAFWLINFLVLGFLFGERALKNLMPLITQAMQARAKG